MRPLRQLKLERFGESLAEMEVELSEDVFLLKTADAQKLLEPPRVAALSIRPAAIQVKPGGKPYRNPHTYEARLLR